MRLLIVDDEPAILESTARLARACGYDVLTCTNHLEVPAVAERAAVNVILQDVRMPGLDLRCHLGIVRSDPRTSSTAVVLFSASMDVQDVASAVAADGFLEKPFTPSDLRTAVERAVAARTPATATDAHGRGLA